MTARYSDKKVGGEVGSTAAQRISTLVKAVVMVAHFVCLLFVAFVTYTAQPGSSLFSWHPTLMTLAFAFCMIQGIMVFSSESSVVSSWQRINKVRLHWGLMLSALLFGLLGLLAIIRNKDLNGYPHFTSWHGQVGLGTVIYVAAQCCAGVLLLYPRVIPRAVGTLWQVKQMHATSALVLYTLVSASLVLGMCSSWFTSKVTGTSWYMCVSCPAILVLVAMQQITSHYLPKPRATAPAPQQ